MYPNWQGAVREIQLNINLKDNLENSTEIKRKLKIQPENMTKRQLYGKLN